MTVHPLLRARAVLDGKALPEDDDAAEAPPILTGELPPDVEVPDDTVDPDQPPLIEDVEVLLDTTGALDLFADADVEPDEAEPDEVEPEPDGKALQAGAFVQWQPPGASTPTRGRVDLVVTKGAVPGFPTVTGTADTPAARVVLYERSAGQWTPTGVKVAVPAPALTVLDTVVTRGVDTADPAGALVALVADHEAAGLTPVPGDAVKAVYDRGVKAWPGPQVTVLTAQQWGLARAGAFLDVAAGKARPGYVGDRDLLPGGRA